MKYSIEQSEITERTEQINKFALLVDLFNKKAVDRETFMAELSKIEQTDWAKENLFNQLIGYCVLGDAYGVVCNLYVICRLWEKKIIYRGL